MPPHRTAERSVLSSRREQNRREEVHTDAAAADVALSAAQTKSLRERFAPPKVWLRKTQRACPRLPLRSALDRLSSLEHLVHLRSRGRAPACRVEAQALAVAGANRPLRPHGGQLIRLLHAAEWVFRANRRRHETWNGRGTAEPRAVGKRPTRREAAHRTMACEGRMHLRHIADLRSQRPQGVRRKVSRRSAANLDAFRRRCPPAAPSRSVRSHSDRVQPASILREFIGSSGFAY